MRASAFLDCALVAVVTLRGRRKGILVLWLSEVDYPWQVQKIGYFDVQTSWQAHRSGLGGGLWRALISWQAQ